MFTAQQSSLYLSLTLVPFSLSLMMAIDKGLSYSGLMLYLFIMLFIGGLLVLLVSVSSLATQEQGVLIPLVIFVLMIILTLPVASVIQPKSNPVSLMSWVLHSEMTLVVLILLCLGLGVISNLVLEFKGLVRSMCPYSVSQHLSFSSSSLSGS